MMVGQIALAQDAEQDLQSRLAQSDPTAFDQLVALYAPRIGRLAYRLLGWREDADDVAIAAYKRAIELFPQTHWADVARQRLRELQT